MKDLRHFIYLHIKSKFIELKHNNINIFYRKKVKSSSGEMRREFIGIKNDMLEYSVKDMISHKIWIETRVNIE